MLGAQQLTMATIDNGGLQKVNNNNNLCAKLCDNINLMNSRQYSGSYTKDGASSGGAGASVIQWMIAETATVCSWAVFIIIPKHCT